MSQWWAVPMLLTGGLFAGVAVIACERVPAWRASDPVDFPTGLAHALRAGGPPAAGAAGRLRWLHHRLASGAGGAARTLALLAAAWLVPIQRRLATAGSPPPPADLEALRAR